MPKIPLRRRENGRLVRVKNAASAANARPKKVAIVYGGASRAIWGALDKRTVLGKAVAAFEAEFRQHAGPDRAATKDDLCVSAARHKALASIAFADLMERGLFDDKGSARPALEAFRRADSELRECLRLLGLKRRSEQVPSLDDYLARKGSGG